MCGLTMSDIPTISPPYNVTSNFDNPQSQKKALYIVNSISLFLMLVCSILHAYTKAFITRITFGLEEGKSAHYFLQTWLSAPAATCLAVVSIVL